MDYFTIQDIVATQSANAFKQTQLMRDAALFSKYPESKFLPMRMQKMEKQIRSFYFALMPDTPIPRLDEYCCNEANGLVLGFIDVERY